MGLGYLESRGMAITIFPQPYQGHATLVAKVLAGARSVRAGWELPESMERDLHASKTRMFDELSLHDVGSSW